MRVNGSTPENTVPERSWRMIATTASHGCWPSTLTTSLLLTTSEYFYFLHCFSISLSRDLDTMLLPGTLPKENSHSRRVPSSPSSNTPSILGQAFIFHLCFSLKYFPLQSPSWLVISHNFPQLHSHIPLLYTLHLTWPANSLVASWNQL